MQRLRIAVLVSGRGSNLKAILEAVASGALFAEVVVVCSDQPQPLAFVKARQHNVPTIFVDPDLYENRENYDRALLQELKGYEIDFVVLAGFMRLLTPVFVQAFSRRLLNIHPSLLPAFPGLDAQRQAWEYGVRFSGCTVHFVDAGMDTGPVILQSVVPVLAEDTPEKLAERILKMEHKTYPAALQLLSEGRIKLQGRRVGVDLQGRIPLRPGDVVEEWKDAARKIQEGGSYFE